MKKIPKQEYTTEFKEQALRNWVKLAEAGKLNGKGTKVCHTGTDGFIPVTC